MNWLAIVFVITKTIANQFIAEAVMQKLVNYSLLLPQLEGLSPSNFSAVELT
jgi:hypothetical protein